MVSDFKLVPGFHDAHFLKEVLDYSLEKEIQVVIPAHEDILVKFSQNKAQFEAKGISVVVSPPETIAIAADKWASYKFLRGALPMATTMLGIPQRYSSPLFIKSRFGSGSKFGAPVFSQEDLERVRYQIPDPISQEYLPGSEYTIECLCDQSNEIIWLLVRKRLSVVNGVCTKFELVDSDEFVPIAKSLITLLDFNGPFFFQAKRSSRGSIAVTEVDARMGGSMCVRTCGQDIHNRAVQVALRQPIGERPDYIIGTIWNRIYRSNPAINVGYK